MTERVEKSVRLFAKVLEEKFQAVVSQTRAVLERALAKKNQEKYIPAWPWRKFKCSWRRSSRLKKTY
ncbi:hypothetical protein [Desulfoscipio gibsoniae]|uniref:hypothetical protein n=1 Tax=Desulfoscipio gibsoniae TaxID=102134 RepID=UPI000310E741|nr:hypothetical protein [Desulfoscipio gibsoniae]